MTYPVEWGAQIGNGPLFSQDALEALSVAGPLS